MSGEDPDSRVGEQFGPYLLKRLLGRGGMGEVYEAEDTVKERVVALKLLSKKFSADPVFRKRMQREARTAGRLQEPHVVPIHDYDEIDGQLYIDMRMIEGVDLRALLNRFGPLTPPRAVAIVRQIASALDAAHAAGVMHRDVKPENILINREDFAYLVDFGIAAANTDEHLTQMGTAVGTWKYMAPERFTNEEVTYRADIYALACVLYECLTGSPPYQMDSAGKLITAHMMEPIPVASRVRPGIPHAFDAVVAKGMAKNPAERYASAGDLALAAHEALSTPDQDHSTTIFQRSQQALGPNQGATMLGPTSHPSAPFPPTDTGRPSGFGPTYTSGPNPMPASAPISSFTGGVPSTTSGPAGTGWPGQFGSPPPGSAGPSWNPPPRKGTPWLPIGIAAAVVLAVLGGVGVWLAWPESTTVETSTPAPTTPAGHTTTKTTKPTTTKPSVAPDTQQLLDRLPAGYSTDNCTESKPQPGTIWENALAIVNCDQNSLNDSPPSAEFALFADVAKLTDAFDQTAGTDTLANCPNGGQQKGPWHHADSPTVNRGMIACGTYKDKPNVIWSDDSLLMLGSVFGNAQTFTLEQLYQWWSTRT